MEVQEFEEIYLWKLLMGQAQRPARLLGHMQEGCGAGVGGIGALGGELQDMLAVVDELALPYWWVVPNAIKVNEMDNVRRKINRAK